MPAIDDAPRHPHPPPPAVGCRRLRAARATTTAPMVAPSLYSACYYELIRRRAPTATVFVIDAALDPRLRCNTRRWEAAPRSEPYSTLRPDGDEPRLRLHITQRRASTLRRRPPLYPTRHRAEKAHVGCSWRRNAPLGHLYRGLRSPRHRRGRLRGLRRRRDRDVTITDTSFIGDITGECDHSRTVIAQLARAQPRCRYPFLLVSPDSHGSVPGIPIPGCSRDRAWGRQNADSCTRCGCRRVPLSRRIPVLLPGS